MITIPTRDFTGVLSDVIPFASADVELPLHLVRLEWDGEMLHALTSDRLRMGISSWRPGDIDPGDEAQDELGQEWGGDDAPWAVNVALGDAAMLAKAFRLGRKQWHAPLTLSLMPGAGALVLAVDDLAGADLTPPPPLLTVRRGPKSGQTAVKVEVEGTEEVFPDLRAVLAKNDRVKAVRRMTFSAALLADFAGVRPRGPLEMAFTGENGLVRVVIGDRFEGAIQPLRSDEEDKRG